jgi:hypothetical protein
MAGPIVDINVVMIEWIPPVLLSIDTCVLFVAILFVTRMSYSRESDCSKIVFWPYYLILIYIAFEIMELLFILREINMFGIQNHMKVIYSWMWMLVSTFSVCKFVLFNLFVCC